MKVAMIMAGNRVDGELKTSSWAVRQFESLQKEKVELEKFVALSRKNPVKLFILGMEIRKFIHKNKCQLAHAQWGTSTGLITALFAPVPVVVSFCGSDLLGNYDRHGRRTLSGKTSVILSQLAALFADSCIAKSRRLRRHLWPISRKNCEVIPNGIDLDIFKPLDKKDCRERLNWDMSDRYMIYFHDDSRQGAWVKNPNLADEIYKNAKMQYSDLHFIKIRNIAHNELPLYYNAADVLLITSRHEGSNNTLKEAMACNLPVVSTNSGDAQERLQNVSHSFVCKTRGHLIKATVDVLAEPVRTDGRIRIQELSIEKIARRIAGLYKNILAKNAS